MLEQLQQNADPKNNFLDNLQILQEKQEGIDAKKSLKHVKNTLRT
jgi:hypothetical protein